MSNFTHWGANASGFGHVFGHKIFQSGNPSPPASPGVPNPNDAANAAQNLTDQMRLRRGLMANIYAGGSAPQPVTGKTQLGT